MLKNKKIKEIIKKFTVNNDVVFMEYSRLNNKKIIIKNELKQKMLDLFDLKNKKINKLELVDAFITILSWYMFYLKRFNEFPKAKQILKEMRDVENLIDELLVKFSNLNEVSKYILKTHKNKNERIFASNWLRPPHKLYRCDYREQYKEMKFKKRRIVRPIGHVVEGLHSKKQFKEYWYAILWNIYLTKHMKRGRNYVMPFIDREFIENLAAISSTAHIRHGQLEAERTRFLNGGRPGEHSLAELIWPSPQIFLMRECGLLLAINGCNIENHFELAKLIHAQSKLLYVCSTKGSISSWGKNHKKEIEDWLNEIKPYVGSCIRTGPNGERIKCVFPSIDQFPTFLTPTLSRCPRIQDDNDPPYPEMPFPSHPKSAELLNGPGWERVGLAHI
ncbi:hypothetical protein [Geothrix sp.]|jgi:hypothetical protein|uniref:hypothetical protein n=1 Tax=Geothrix sp. TaxID=1962974 RepID=UPI0025BE9818|nr:hypothetical protein [Geothrix sp.]